MGTLVYGHGEQSMRIEDRALRHLQVVIIAKLRRGEGFAFQWDMPVAEGNGSVALWMHPSAHLVFQFDDNAAPAMNRQWLELLSLAANSGSGLRLLPEPDSAEGSPADSRMQAAARGL